MWFQNKNKSGSVSRQGIPSYRDCIDQCAAMVGDRAAGRAAERKGLHILDVTWEDTGRFKGSCVGPNISDMTIQVEHEGEITCMPVFRFPNFSDVSADLELDGFQVLVGNEKDQPLRPVTLREYLGNLRAYLSEPDSWTGAATSLLAERDEHLLVSAQACFLPVPKKGKAQFNPVLFNYQSHAGAPAVLAILATREGTSATIIDNSRDGFAGGRSWGQRLFFNQNGERAALTGERLTDCVESGAVTGEPAEQDGLNMVLMIQVPLLQPEPPAPAVFDGLACGGSFSCRSRRASDVEAAVIGHGDVEGPFTEIDDLPIARDTRFPIRVTVQFYKATSNGVVSEADVADIRAEIDRVYADAAFVGSLVVAGETGRPTEYDSTVPKTEPADWWARFWARRMATR